MESLKKIFIAVRSTLAKLNGITVYILRFRRDLGKRSVMHRIISLYIIVSAK